MGFGTNGCSLPTFVIFKGKRIQQSWISSQMDEQTVLHVSENGWTDRLIALDWLEHFNTYTKAQTRRKYRLLILDGPAALRGLVAFTKVV